MSNRILKSSVPKVKLLRSDSSGLSGTFANISHHAEIYRRVVTFLAKEVSTHNFAWWVQGHNTHKLITHDGREFALTTYQENGSYVGIVLQAIKREGRKTNRIDVMKCPASAEYAAQWAPFANVLRALAEH